MILTYSDVQPLSSDDLNFLDAHPHIAHLVIKGCKIEKDASLSEVQKQHLLFVWALAILPLPIHPRS